VAGALSDLERAQQILSHLAESGAISKGYLQSQIDLIREQADKAAEVEVKIPVQLGSDEDAHVRDQQWAKLKAEFARQQETFPPVAVKLDQDGLLAEATDARKRLEAVLSQAIRLPVVITPQLAGAGNAQVPVVIPIGGSNLSGSLDTDETDLRTLLAREADKRGG